jgi:hypothetical protein
LEIEVRRKDKSKIPVDSPKQKMAKKNEYKDKQPSKPTKPESHIKETEEMKNKNWSILKPEPEKPN